MTLDVVISDCIHQMQCAFGHDFVESRLGMILKALSQLSDAHTAATAFDVLSAPLLSDCPTTGTIH
jgi:hypothetical protein